MEGLLGKIFADLAGDLADAAADAVARDEDFDGFGASGGFLGSGGWLFRGGFYFSHSRRPQSGTENVTQADAEDKARRVDCFNGDCLRKHTPMNYVFVVRVRGEMRGTALPRSA